MGMLIFLLVALAVAWGLGWELNSAPPPAPPPRPAQHQAAAKNLPTANQPADQVPTAAQGNDAGQTTETTTNGDAPPQPAKDGKTTD